MANTPGGWLTPDADWIAKPVNRGARYLDALRAIGPPPNCGCADLCRARREWHAMVDGTLDAWLLDREQMEGRRG